MLVSRADSYSGEMHGHITVRKDIEIAALV